MPDIRLNEKIPKLIAFYLPQFHTIPENDNWYGKGFTEWTNVRKAEPLFEGHDQPKIPLEKNYYDLSDDDVKIWQAKLAKKYGIFGFCYYHYWFKDGKKLLEKPAEQMLVNQEIDQSFCFCWANENWSKNWDGGNHEVIMKQEYGGEKEWEQHFQYLLPFFKDPRYITVEGKPLFLIYKPEQIIDIEEMVSYFKNRSIEEGFAGLCTAFQFPTYFADMFYNDNVFDFRIEFEPVFSRNTKFLKNPGTASKIQVLRKISGEKIIAKYRKKRQNHIGAYAKPQYLSMFFYDEAWKNILDFPMDRKLLPGCFVDWDNTPRNRHGVVYSGFTIQKFAEYFYQIVYKAKCENKPMLFINAWNEWGEGAFLEPDEKYGYAKLEAIREAIEKIKCNEIL